MAEHKKRVYVASLKTFYTQISQAIQKIKYDTNCTDFACLGLGADVDDDTWNDNLHNLISSQLNIVKYIKKPTTKERVRFYDLGKAHSYCDLGCLSSSSPKVVVFYTQNGFKFEIYTSDASKNISFFVDINGNKNPNILGRDVFSFYIPANMAEVVPLYGYKYSHVYYHNSGSWWKNASGLCNTDSTYNANGIGCAARIIESGWVMDY